VNQPAPDIINVGKLVDDQRIGWFLLGIVVLGFLAQIGDGYDLAAAAYAAPGITASWHIPRPALAPVFSASLFGMLFGAPLFGYMGDRIGRRSGIVLCSFICAGATLATATAHSLPELIALRFITGLGLGGLPANTIAIMAEYAPKRSRAILITCMFMGITFGGIVPAIVTTIAPHGGWQMLFVVGGVMPLVAGILNFLFMPESFKFLALRRASPARLVALARRMGAAIGPNATPRFVFAAEPARRFPLGALFEARLRFTTPLIWLIFITNLMANFFLNSWMPTLFRAAGLTASDAAMTTSMYYVGGIVGGLVIGRALDRVGMGIIPLFMLLACPAVILLGDASTYAVGLKLAVFAVGVTVLGNQLALNALVGLVYPTAIRANGAGWALGVGRLGAICGPLIGGALLARHLPTTVLFMAPAVPLLIGAVAGFLLRAQAAERFGQGAVTAEAQPR
jgi:AAHS family 4-hydroxybenzoate transporter-like MFS transporter